MGTESKPAIIGSADFANLELPNPQEVLLTAMKAFPGGIKDNYSRQKTFSNSDLAVIGITDTLFPLVIVAPQNFWKKGRLQISEKNPDLNREITINVNTKNNPYSVSVWLREPTFDSNINAIVDSAAILSFKHYELDGQGSKQAGLNFATVVDNQIAYYEELKGKKPEYAAVFIGCEAHEKDRPRNIHFNGFVVTKKQ